jgi:hypothetical protein
MKAHGKISKLKLEKTAISKLSSEAKFRIVGGSTGCTGPSANNISQQPLGHASQVGQCHTVSITKIHANMPVTLASSNCSKDTCDTTKVSC